MHTGSFSALLLLVCPIYVYLYMGQSVRGRNTIGFPVSIPRDYLLGGWWGRLAYDIDCIRCGEKWDGVMSYRSWHLPDTWSTRSR